jgi:L-ascorbate metabolism protein UlaG (beta-lactamase superfamily)
MKITKLGHCCMFIETGKLNILTDPGNFSTKQDELKNIDIVLITHEHQDHLHVESLKKVLKNNPSAKVITNNAVKKILEKEKIKSELLTHGMKKEIKGILFEGLGEKHAEIYKTVTPVENTGYFINDFFFPGDALTVPKRKVKILALPVAGPWIKVSESIDYCLAVKPEIAIPVHDGMQAVKINARIVRGFVEPKGIKWHSIDETPLEF